MLSSNKVKTLREGKGFAPGCALKAVTALSYIKPGVGMLHSTILGLFLQIVFGKRHRAAKAELFWSKPGPSPPKRSHKEQHAKQEEEAWVGS